MNLSRDSLVMFNAPPVTLKFKLGYFARNELATAAIPGVVLGSGPQNSTVCGGSVAADLGLSPPPNWSPHAVVAIPTAAAATECTTARRDSALPFMVRSYFRGAPVRRISR